LPPFASILPIVSAFFSDYKLLFMYISLPSGYIKPVIEIVEWACLSRRSQVKGMDVFMIMDRIALVLVIVGGLNWGSVGIFGFDMIAALFGGQSAAISRVIYTLVGLSALWCISLLFRERDVVDENVS